ncbi:MAG: alanine--glyoxylate aminotransferase family protein [Dehalococcoidia bacterium]|nr:alanine--glyoxylate aminotransferase family protein [Dehalococcoidia bacterium]MDZ4247285.1 alanine--glyoxylate aminotransferase family protein [Dehalococcoidia bacterium]
MNLRIPGPTPCPDQVLKAMGKQMINHRGKEFRSILEQVTQRLKIVYQTTGDVFVLTCSGTGGMEAAIVNTLSPGDGILATTSGAFGNRFAEIGEAFGGRVQRLQFEWGKPVEAEAVKKALEDDPSIKAVLVTHNETSTGVTNDVKAISAVAKKAGKLLLVDAISSLGSIDLQTDNWKCDVVVTCSQKGLMSPPGLAAVSFSEQAWQAQKTAKMPRYNWDFAKARSFQQKGETPWTPAVSAVYAVNAALEMIIQEGLPRIFQRQARISRMVREGVKSLGLELFGDEKCPSDIITAVKATNGLDPKKLLNVMEDKYDVILAGGQQKLDGKIFRIGHLGWVSEKEIENVLASLKKALPEAGFNK